MIFLERGMKIEIKDAAESGVFPIWNYYRHSTKLVIQDHLQMIAKL